jgi:hypothetical protein
METVCFSKTLASTNKATWCQNPEEEEDDDDDDDDHHHHHHHCPHDYENLKSHTMNCLLCSSLWMNLQ